MESSRPTYTWFTDEDHSWLRVPLADVDVMKMRQWLTRDSFVSETHYFLEKEIDATLFLASIKKAGVKPKFRVHAEELSSARKHPGVRGANKYSVHPSRFKTPEVSVVQLSKGTHRVVNQMAEGPVKLLRYNRPIGYLVSLEFFNQHFKEDQ